MEWSPDPEPNKRRSQAVPNHWGGDPRWPVLTSAHPIGCSGVRRPQVADDNGVREAKREEAVHSGPAQVHRFGQHSAGPAHAKVLAMVRRDSGAPLVGAQRHDPRRPLLQHHHRLRSGLLQSRCQTAGQWPSIWSAHPSDASSPVRSLPGLWSSARSAYLSTRRWTRAMASRLDGPRLRRVWASSLTTDATPCPQVNTWSSRVSPKSMSLLCVSLRGAVGVSVGAVGRAGLSDAGPVRDGHCPVLYGTLADVRHRRAAIRQIRCDRSPDDYNCDSAVVGHSRHRLLDIWGIVVAHWSLNRIRQTIVND